MFPSDSQADKYNKLLHCVYDPFRALHILEHIVAVDINTIQNIIFIIWAPPTARVVKYLGHIKASKTLFEDIDFHVETKKISLALNPTKIL